MMKRSNISTNTEGVSCSKYEEHKKCQQLSRKIHPVQRKCNSSYRSNVAEDVVKKKNPKKFDKNKDVPNRKIQCKGRKKRVTGKNITLPVTLGKDMTHDNSFCSLQSENDEFIPYNEVVSDWDSFAAESVAAAFCSAEEATDANWYAMNNDNTERADCVDTVDNDSGYSRSVVPHISHHDGIAKFRNIMTTENLFTGSSVSRLKANCNRSNTSNNNSRSRSTSSRSSSNSSSDRCKKNDADNTANSIASSIKNIHIACDSINSNSYSINSANSSSSDSSSSIGSNSISSSSSSISNSSSRCSVSRGSNSSNNCSSYSSSCCCSYSTGYNNSDNSCTSCCCSSPNSYIGDICCNSYNNNIPSNSTVIISNINTNSSSVNPIITNTYEVENSSGNYLNINDTIHASQQTDDNKVDINSRNNQSIILNNMPNGLNMSMMNITDINLPQFIRPQHNELNLQYVASGSTNCRVVSDTSGIVVKDSNWRLVLNPKDDENLLLHSLAWASSSVVMKLILTADDAAWIVGRGGYHIREMRTKTGADLFMGERRPENSSLGINDRLLTIRGCVLSKYKAVCLLLSSLELKRMNKKGNQMRICGESKHRKDEEEQQQFNDDEEKSMQNYAVRLVVPRRAANLLVEENGVMLNHLCSITKAAISICPQEPMHGEKLIDINGMGEAKIAAAIAFLQKLEEMRNQNINKLRLVLPLSPASFVQSFTSAATGSPISTNIPMLSKTSSKGSNELMNTLGFKQQPVPNFPMPIDLYSEQSILEVLLPKSEVDLLVHLENVGNSSFSEFAQKSGSQVRLGVDVNNGISKSILFTGTPMANSFCILLLQQRLIDLRNSH